MALVPYEMTVEIVHNCGWAPLPCPAASVVSVLVIDQDPEVVGTYPVVPVFAGIALDAGPHSPNGAAVFSAPAAVLSSATNPSGPDFVLDINGTYGIRIWSNQ